MQRENKIAKRPRRDRRTADDGHIAGVERIDASPEDIARALFAPNDRRVRAAAKARRKGTAE